MKTKKTVVAGAVLVLLACSAAFATLSNKREAVEYFKGHTHNGGETTGAPSHSGGTDAYGCHNGSVPYHCH